MLNNVINNAISNLGVKQYQVGLASQNVSNSDDPNATAKNAILVSKNGVNIPEDVQRNIDATIRKQRIYAESDVHKTNEFIKSMDVMEAKIGSPDSNQLIMIDETARIQAAIYAISNKTPNADIDMQNIMQDFNALLNSISNIKHTHQNIISKSYQLINESVHEVNHILRKINAINQNIMSANLQSKENFKDEQEKLISSLSEKMNVRFFRKTNDQVVITTSKWDIMLDTTSSKGDLVPILQYKDGNVYLHNRDITNSITSGTMGGSIQGIAKTQELIDNHIAKIEDNLMHDINHYHANSHSAGGARSYSGIHARFDNNIVGKGQIIISSKGNQPIGIDINGAQNINDILSRFNQAISQDGMHAKITPDGKFYIEGQRDFIIDMQHASINSENGENSFADYFGMKQLFMKENGNIIMNKYYQDNPDQISVSNNYNIANRNYIGLQEIGNIIKDQVTNHAKNFITQTSIVAKNAKTDQMIAKNELDAWKVFDTSENGIDVLEEQEKIRELDLSISASMNIIKVINKLINDVISLSSH